MPSSVARHGKSRWRIQVAAVTLTIVLLTACAVGIKQDDSQPSAPAPAGETDAGPRATTVSDAGTSADDHTTSEDSSAPDVHDAAHDASHDAAACANLIGPSVNGTACHGCGTHSCQPNGCYGGYFCDTLAKHCVSPPANCP